MVRTLFEPWSIFTWFWRPTQTLEGEGTNLIVVSPWGPRSTHQLKITFQLSLTHKNTNKHHTHTSVACVVECCWPKCELVIQLIFPCKIIFLQFDEIITKSYSKFNIFSSLESTNFQITSIKSYSFTKCFPPIRRLVNPQNLTCKLSYSNFAIYPCYFHSKFLDLIEKHVIVIN